MTVHYEEAAVVVRIDCNNPEAITRCFTDEWQDYFYPLNTEEEVLQHWAANAIFNGYEDASRLEGWADLQPGEVTFLVDMYMDFLHSWEESTE